MARTSNYALRLLVSMKAEAEKVAADEGTTLNQFINVAVAEKLAALRTARYFQDRASRADLTAFDRLLTQAGREPPRPGDEINGGALRTRPSQRRQPQSLSGTESRPGMTKTGTRGRK